jgi:hypothetical protein
MPTGPKFAAFYVFKENRMSPLQFARQSMEDIARCKSFLDDGHYPEFTVSHWELRNAFDAVVKETRCPPSALAD